MADYYLCKHGHPPVVSVSTTSAPEPPKQHKTLPQSPNQQVSVTLMQSQATDDAFAEGKYVCSARKKWCTLYEYLRNSLSRDLAIYAIACWRLHHKSRDLYNQTFPYALSIPIFLGVCCSFQWRQLVNLTKGLVSGISSWNYLMLMKSLMEIEGLAERLLQYY